VKAGRKKAKKGEAPAPEQATPRIRAAVAREAAIKARLEVEQAEAKARAALEAVETASRAANRELPPEPVPLQIEPPPEPLQGTPNGPTTQRYKSITHSFCCSL
jgi:hypothetical protein